MTLAYSEYYLDDACNLLGSYFDSAVNYYRFSLKEAWKKFVESSFSKSIQKGDPKVISGMSGSELVCSIFDIDKSDSGISLERSPEYWLGYYLAYFNWYTSIKFSFIAEYFDINDILKMYAKYHEMDVSIFIEDLCLFLNEKKKKTNLEIYRLKSGMTRKELSIRTGVPLRTIEQYEQNFKDINNAKSITLFRLSKALFVEPEDLLELTRI